MSHSCTCFVWFLPKKSASSECLWSPDMLKFQFLWWNFRGCIHTLQFKFKCLSAHPTNHFGWGCQIYKEIRLCIHGTAQTLKVKVCSKQTCTICNPITLEHISVYRFYRPAALEGISCQWGMNPDYSSSVWITVHTFGQRILEGMSCVVCQMARIM